MLDITIEQGDNPEWRATIRQGLSNYNREQVGNRDVTSLVLVAKNADGAVVGGLTGESIWGWMLIETFWVSDEHRRQGYGRQLLAEAERVAIERGCTNITLETFSFQALPFYRKQGYVIYGQLDNFPAGQTRYSLKKDLTAEILPSDLRSTGEFQASMYQYDTAMQQHINLHTDALYGIIIDLIQRHDKEDLLQKIVDSAAQILKSPYGEIMLLEGEELVVHAFTRNQPYLMGDRVKRGEALISWRAFDTRLPVMVDDYINWSGKRVVYDTGLLRAVADFPVMLGETCIGVLAMGRTAENHTFTQEDANIGMQFAQLVAVVLDNIALYNTTQAQNETLKATNQALAVARHQAESASRMKSQFLANMSHELRTPLNAIIGYAQLLTAGIAGDLNEEQHGYQNRIYANSQHLLHLINEVLDLSKIEAGKIELAAETINPRQLLAEVEAQTRILADSKGITITITPDETLPEQVMGDHGRVKQILINLLSNAIKFTDKGGVTIHANRPDESHWAFSVTDTGMGIPAHLLESVFDEFHQINSPKKQGGTGLGLAITRKLIALMGGSITAQSDIGRGSTFSVVLPLHQPTKGISNAP